MPIYEFHCESCDVTHETLRRIKDHKKVFRCPACNERCKRRISVPQPPNWNSEEKFPNLRKEGDGTMTFGSRAEYEAYLADNGIYELGGPRASKCATKTVQRFGSEKSRPGKRPLATW